jgi:hypothetical protein
VQPVAGCKRSELEDESTEVSLMMFSIVYSTIMRVVWCPGTYEL